MQHNPPPIHRPRRRARRWPWLLLGALLTAALAIPLLHHLAHRAAQQALLDAAARHGWSARWDDLSLGFDLSAQLTGFHATHPRGAQLDIPHARARWGLDAVLLGERLPHLIELRAPSLTLATADLAPDAKGAPSAPSTDPTQRLLRALRPLDLTLHVTDARLQTPPSGPLPAALLTNISLHAQPQDDAWTAQLGGRCDQGCGEPQRWQASLTLTEGAADLDARLERPLQLQPPLPLEDVSITLRAAALHARLDATDGALTLSAPDAAASARHPRYHAELALPAATARWRLDDLKAPPQLLITGPQLTLRPNAAAPGAAAPPDPKGPAADSAPLALLAQTDQWSKPIQRAWSWLERLRVTDATLHLPDRDLTLRGLGAQTLDGALELSWQDPTGRLALLLDPDQPYPRVTLEEVHVAAWLNRLGLQTRHQLDGRLSGTIALEPSAPMPPLPDLPAPARPADLRKAADRGLHLRGDLHLRAAQLYIDGLSQDPIAQDRLDASLDIYYAPAAATVADRLSVQSLSLRLPSRAAPGEVTVQLRAEVRALRDPQRAPALWFSLAAQQAPCQGLVGAIPAAMLPRLADQLKLSGQAAPSLTAWVDLRDPYTLDFNLDDLPGGCRLLSLGRYSPAFLNDSFVHEVTVGVTRPGIKVGPGTQSFVPLSSMPAHVGASAFLTEEIAFYRNPGFAIGLIKKALRLNLEKGRYVYGGSTVSQQLVKNLFLTRDKTLSRKLEEAFIVWKMEELLTKDRILELYLNCIEFGPDLYGIGPASRRYFNKPPSRLTPLEGAFLAALKPAPWYGDRFYRAGHTPDRGWWRERLETVMARLYEHGYVTQEDYLGAAPYIVTFRDTPLPEAAPLRSEDLSAPAPPPALAPQPAAPAPTPTPEKPKNTDNSKRYKWEDLPEGRSP